MENKMDTWVVQLFVGICDMSKYGGPLSWQLLTLLFLRIGKALAYNQGCPG